MHDPKFEQKVQQKMEELEFTPSAAVWTRVEQAVNEKKRRRAPLFWWFLLPGLILTGAGLLYLHHTADHVVIAHPAVANPVPGGKDHSAPVISSIPGTNNTPERDLTVPGASTPAGAGPERRAKAGTGAIAETNAPVGRSGFGATNKPVIKNEAVTKSESAIKNGTGAKSGAGSKRVLSTRPVSGTTGDWGETSTPEAIGTPGTRNASATKNDAMVTNPPVTNGADHLTAARAAHPIASPRLAAVGPLAYNVQGARLPVSKMPVSGTPVSLQHKHKWEAGFTGGAGVSSLNANFIQKTVISADLRATAAMTPTPITSNAKNNYTSNVEPGVSYWAGIYMQRYLMPRLSLSVGLNLHYYTSRMKVGEKVDYTYNTATQSYLFISDSTANANASAQLSAPYYTVGTDYNYTNRYFFLELPIAAQWRLNRSAHMPLYWEGGVTLSRLIISNGLYYNLHSGVYQRDRAVFNKTQFNISTALLVGLPIKGIRLAVGPQLQYGLTNLLNTQTTGAEHLFYGGIKIVLTR